MKRRDFVVRSAVGSVALGTGKIAFAEMPATPPTRAATRKILAYFNLFKNLANWRTWLATKGPLLVALSVDATWDNATATQGKLDTFQPTTVRGGHAVAVVGYRTDTFPVSVARAIR